MSDKPEKAAESPDYRSTLFLPATDFPMKAGLPEAEPKWLARWAEMDLYGKLRAKAKGRRTTTTAPKKDSGGWFDWF